jgi:hypothetical protein
LPQIAGQALILFQELGLQQGGAKVNSKATKARTCRCLR